MVDYEDMDREELEDAVLAKFESLYHDTWGWESNGGRDDVADAIGSYSEEALLSMMEIPSEQWESLADYGFWKGAEEPPDWLLELGWYDDDGDWHNPFWYH